MDLKEPLDLSVFERGYMDVWIKGTTQSNFELGFQSGLFSDGSQRSAAVLIGPDQEYQIDSSDYRIISIPLAKIKAETNLNDVRAPLYVKGISNFDGEAIYIRRILYRES